jgi:cyclophilin family peptidyl-prolyl cis-trans isomerase
MNTIFKISGALLFFSVFTLACSSSKPKTKTDVDKNTYVIETEFGSMTIKLFDATPKHRDNFKKLVADTFYNGTLFHRIIPGFMIQGGDPTSKNADTGQQLGSGNLSYTIDAEFVDSLIHKKGALAAARQSDNVNPMKSSSGSQFYIVQGVVVQPGALARVEQNINAGKKRALATVVFEDSLNAELKKKFLRARTNQQKDSASYYGGKLEEKLNEAMIGNEFKYSPKQIALYDSLGGTPHLDGGYTVFGEVISGLNIIDSIANAKKNGGNRPLEDIKMIIKKL